jgi:penicillin-binding protein 2
MVRVNVACKTGTAEIGGKDTKPHAWLTVFAPYNEPEIVVTVLVENGGEGSQIAGPIATEIVKKYFENKK